MLRSLPNLLLLPALLGLLASGCDGTAPPRPPTFTKSTSQPGGEALRLQGRVNDAAGLLPGDVERRLDSRLAALEAATGHQLVVVTVASLGEEDIADYTLYLGRR
jgi:uncharacterized protein